MDDNISWLQPVSIKYRYVRAAIALAIGVSIAGWLAYLQFSNKVVYRIENLWILVPLAISAWRVYYRVSLETELEYAHTVVRLTLKQRLRKTAPIWAGGFGAAGLIFWLQNAENRFRHNWGWSAAYACIGLIGLFIAAVWRHQKVLTPEAARRKAEVKAEDDLKLQAQQKASEEFWDRPVIRYPGSVALFGLAYFLMEHVHRDKDWWGVGAAALLGLVLAREVSIWIVGIAAAVGIGWALYAGISALPVSVAVIIGALIIASAVRR